MSDDEVSFGSNDQSSILFVPPRPGRCVGDPVEMQRQRALMSIPTFNDSLRYITLMQALISEATTRWLAYSSAVTADYANAYSDQAGTLKAVKKALEERMKREEAFATFALNLLTVGVGGALAGQAVKLAVKGLGAKEEFIEKAVDIAKEKVTEPIQKATEWSYKKLGLELQEDPFEPPGVSPTEFGARLNTTVLYQSGALQGMLSRLLMSGDISVQGARNLAQIIIPSPYIQSAPKDEIKPGDLKAKALLSLWLAWAWARDDVYWASHGTPQQYNDRNKDERVDFEPVRRKLLSLGVPVNVASQQDEFSLWMNRTEIKDVINMPAFLKWANGTEWIPVMFNKSTPQDDVWVSKLPQQMAQVKLKKVLKQFGAGEE